MGSDDFIPDLDWDGTGTTADDLKDSGGFVSKPGYYHVDLRERTLVQKENEPAHVKLMFVVEGGEHADQIGKQLSHRLYLQKWEYKLDEKGEVVKEKKHRTSDGGEYEAKVKTGRVLPLEPDDFATKGNIRFFVGLGLLSDEQAVGKKFKLPLSKLNPGLQCIVKAGKDGIEFNKTYTLDSPEVEGVPKNEEMANIWRAGVSGGGVSDELIGSL